LEWWGEFRSLHQTGKKILPPKEHVGIMTATDKRFGMMEYSMGKMKNSAQKHRSN
jgi:CRISPR/Cas system-associated protein endoribonuclease Cas2